MALQKQSVPINFSQGLDLKTDPKQIQIGRFLSLENSVFDKGGLLTKRNGYGQLSLLPTGSNSTFVTTFNGNLVATGGSINAYSESTQMWVNQGPTLPVNLSTLPLVRNSTNQSQADVAVSSTGLVCTVYTDNVPTGNGTVTAEYKYTIADSTTGQTLVNPQLIPNSGTITGSPKVFVLGNYFIIVISNLISNTNHLQALAISLSSLTAASTLVNISSNYSPSSSVNFDGVVVNNLLYLAWNGSDVGNAVRVVTLSPTLLLGSPVVFTGQTATLMSICGDYSSGQIYVSYYNSSTSTGYTLSLSETLTTVFSPKEIISTGTVLNLASSAQNGVCTVLYEVSNSYGYDSTIPSNYVDSITVSSTGTVGTAVNFIRSVGLASKSFIVDEVIYALFAYSSSYQPSYFLANTSGQIVAKLAYSNGGGYLTAGLPNVSVFGNSVSTAYLYKDLISSVNKGTNLSTGTQVAGIYSQTGVNLVTFDVGNATRSSVEIGSNLHLSGGFLWDYDGQSCVENGFFVWPDNVEATYNASATVSITGNVSSGSKTISGISSTSGIYAGMSVSGTGIPPGAYVISVYSTSIIISVSATSSTTGASLTVSGQVAAQPGGTSGGNTNVYYYQVTYEWIDNQGNVARSAPSIPISVTTTGSASTGAVTLNIPTLRLTYKTSTPVNICVYRWSVGQQIYYEVTSIQSPLQNSTTSDYVTFVDTYGDSFILGNAILYTTGGVVEDISPPATSIMTLFDTRLWLVDAEDPNLLWFSKQVIEATPVEMSDLFTLYIAPTISAQGSTGPITALAAMDDKLIIFKKDAIYYLNGVGPDNTGANNGYSPATFITATVGCALPNSIVLQPSGLMFQSDKGIWLLGRDLSTSYIGAAVEDLTSTATVESAVNVPATNQIRFTLDSGITLMYDYYYQQWGTFVNVPAVSSTLYNGLHTFINDSGAVFQETPGYYLDGGNPVLLSFTTGWINVAGLQGYERAYFLYLLAQYITPHKLQVSISYDYETSPTQISIISPDNYTPAWGGDALWGSNESWGGPNGSREQWRVILQKQRCQSFQVSVTEIYDPSYGISAGAGFTMSGLLAVVGVKKGYTTLRPGRTVG